MKKWKASLNLLIVLLLIFASACSNSNESAQETKNPSKDNQQNTQQKQENLNPLGKYDPPIQLSTVRWLSSSMSFKTGEDLNNNIWYKTYEDELGIKLSNQWIVNEDQYDSKLNLTITSGDLPDFFKVNATQLKQLVEGGKLEDLTKLYDKYAAPFTKEMIENGPIAKKAATFDGKLMAIPPSQSLTNRVLWVRTDWLKKLNLPEPKTMQDLFKISSAFTHQDPDGNGKKDTYGLGASMNLWDYWVDLEGFVNSFHAYQGIWTKDSSGKLVYGSVQPEMKAALAKLQEMYKDGQIDPEFGVKNSAKAQELVSSGKAGLYYGALVNPDGPLLNNAKNDPKADWQAYPFPSIDGSPAAAQNPLSFNQFFVVKKGVKNPEAVIKLLNLTLEKIESPRAAVETHHTSPEGIALFHYRAINGGTVLKRLMERRELILNAIKTGDESKLDTVDKQHLGNLKKAMNGDRSLWNYEKIYGNNGSLEIQRKYRDKELPLMSNEYYGPPTPTMVERQATLKKLELETFTNIILGNSLDKFDKFVNDWKNLGGNDITKEVNAWYETKK
ncbi:putative aldouronate transport system substrate-binding protein [Paenibacillus sp. yr247]|uniref:extracellular solute-binding protein n=1 Tax=Paenibacillus sp. yr247 TaxID=1761880 RepID=UPI00088A529A|nr:extracellular solute-binding protein [Paenibacillus sp. yr247]SDO24248.1 putative aldouronate transport system substrate-binding protein [Paenibacillus sp. yr247]